MKNSKKTCAQKQNWKKPEQSSDYVGTYIHKGRLYVPFSFTVPNGDITTVNGKEYKDVRITFPKTGPLKGTRCIVYHRLNKRSSK